MARFRPPLEELSQLVEPLNHGEEAVARALAALDDDWTVYIQPRLGQDVPDFVAVHGRHGVCIIEVKDWKPSIYRQRDDGRIECRRGSGEWTGIDEQPRYQAFRYRTTIFDLFFAELDQGTRPTEQVRAAVVFPQMSGDQARKLVDRPSVTDDEHGIAVWGGDDLRQQIESIVRGGGCPRPDPRSLTKLRRQLAESSVALELREPVRLSGDARNIESNPNNARRRRVKGPAGSGKSFGLTARAARLAADGKEVLVLSFNTTLSNYLGTLTKARCREYGANPTLVTCTSFHSFCKRLVDDAERCGLTTTQHEGRPWFDDIVERAREACEGDFAPKRFDAVLIDEGQDFTLDWWNLLRHHIVTDDGEMLLVADPTQDIFDKQAWTDEEQMLGAGFSGRWTTLTSSYRMPNDLVEIANEFARRYVPGERLSGNASESIEGRTDTNRSRSVRRWTNIDHPADLGIEVGRVVVRLLAEHPEINPNDVAFLLELHEDGLHAVNEIEGAGHQVHHMFSASKDRRRTRKQRFWPDADGVKGCTVHSFKGWETPTLVMGIARQQDSRRLAYVSMTRAKGDWTGAPSFISVVNTDLHIAPFHSRFVEWAPPSIPVLEASRLQPVPT